MRIGSLFLCGAMNPGWFSKIVSHIGTRRRDTASRVLSQAFCKRIIIIRKDTKER